MRNVGRLGVAALALGALLASAAPAFAGSGSVTPNPVPVSSGQTSASVTFQWSGLPNNQLLFVHQCRKPASDPTFNFAVDCGVLSEILVNGGPNTGSGQITYNVFRGSEPSGDSDWGCFAPGDAAPSGITKITECHIRIAPNAANNNAEAFSVPFTFTESGGGDIPEAPLPLLLPLAGVAAAGGAFVLFRRRRNNVASV